MTIGLLMLTEKPHAASEKSDDVASRTPPRVWRSNAPFPDEHVEEVGPEGGSFHLRWIPETSHTTYINGDSALNLSGEGIGKGGDWHKAGWWVPCEHMDEAVHFAKMSTDPEWAETVRDIQNALGDLELVDARGALRTMRHPAGNRLQPVWCTTHVRAILEEAWSWMREYEKDSPGTTMECVAPGTVARWLAEREQWIALHEFGERIAVDTAAQAGLEEPWREWLKRQTPVAHYTQPDATWNLAELDRLSLEQAK